MLKLNLSAVYVAFVLVFIQAPEINAQESCISTQELNQATIAVIQCFDTLDNLIGYGTAFMIYNYEPGARHLFVTAAHVLDKADAVNLRFSANEELWTYFQSPVKIRDSVGTPLYYIYDDLALLVFQGINRNTNAPALASFARSQCEFSDSVHVGDRLVAFGFADMERFDFIKDSYTPMATAGIVAFKTPTSYALDKEVHGGMSGGVVFKECPSRGGQLVLL